MQVFLLETVGIALPHPGLGLLHGAGRYRVDGTDHLEFAERDHHLYAGQVQLGHVRPDIVAHEEDAGFAVADQMPEVGRLELVEDWHDHGAVGHRRQIGDAPVDLVLGTDGHPVARFEAAGLEKQVQLRNLTGQILVIERLLIVVGQGRAIPVVLETLFKKHVQGFLSGGFLSHSVVL